MFDSQVTLHIEDIERATAALGYKPLSRAVRVGVRESVLVMVRDAVLNRLRGQYLNRITGTLIRSVTASPSSEATDTLVRGQFGTHLWYGKAHEIGWAGTMNVPAHTRRLHLTREIKKGKRAGERARRSERQRLAWALEGHKTVAEVRAHTRHVRFRARHYLRDTIRANTGKTRLRIAQALLILARTGKPPTATQVRGAFGG